MTSGLETHNYLITGLLLSNSMWILVLSGAAEKSAKHGTDDKTQSIIVAMKARMECRETERPEIFEQIRCIDVKCFLGLTQLYFVANKESKGSRDVDIKFIKLNDYFSWLFYSFDFSEVFRMEPKTHAGHMKAVKNLILDGTSKWLAKIYITGKYNKTTFSIGTFLANLK